MDGHDVLALLQGVPNSGARGQETEGPRMRKLNLDLIEKLKIHLITFAMILNVSMK